MSEEYTETSYQGVGSRLGSSIIGILTGVLLFLGSFGLLLWNEGRAAKTYRALKEGSSSVVTVDSGKQNPYYNGKLVHFTAEAKTDETLTDPKFGLTVPNALKLKREVEMYQYKENEKKQTRKKLGGGQETVRTYTYEKVWSDKLISSSSFHKAGHANPTAKPFPTQETIAKKISAGAFTLGPSFIDDLKSYETIPATQELLAKSAPDVQAKAKLAGEQLYVGADPSSPAIGDARITFKAAKPSLISVVGKQGADGAVTAFMSSNGQDISSLEYGTVTAADMFKHQVSKNNIFTWILRGVGTFVMWFGLMLIVGPLRVLGDIIPFLGDLVGIGVGIVAGILAVALSLLTIAMGWMFYNPLIGVPLLIVVALLFMKLRSMRKGQKAQRLAGFGGAPAMAGAGIGNMGTIGAMATPGVAPIAPPPPPPPPPVAPPPPVHNA